MGQSTKRKLLTGLLAALLCCLGLAGCGKEEKELAHRPCEDFETISFCQQLDRDLTQDEMDALTALDKFWELMVQYSRDGGYPEMPEEMREYVEEPILPAIEGLIRSDYEDGAVYSGDNPYFKVHVVDKTRNNSEVALDVCIIPSNTGVYTYPDGWTHPAAFSYQTQYFKRFDGKMKFFSGTADDWATSCPF